MEIYNEFSKVYDHFMDNVPYEAWGEFIHEILRSYGIQEGLTFCDLQNQEGLSSCDLQNQGGLSSCNLQNHAASKQPLVLELGCGTGSMTEVLAGYGYDMIGIDNSSTMLEIAKNKETVSGDNILYLLQDMREFELYGSVKAVVCVCDSINYILELLELKQVFHLVNHYLDPEGLFIFDFNTDYKYREVIGNQTIAENREDKSFIWENYYYEEERINEIELSLFMKENEGKLANCSTEDDSSSHLEDDSSNHLEEGTTGIPYRKYIETHHQRAYHLQEIKEALEEAGLEFIKSYDDYTYEEVHEDSQRVVVVARK